MSCNFYLIILFYHVKYTFLIPFVCLMLKLNMLESFRRLGCLQICVYTKRKHHGPNRPG